MKTVIGRYVGESNFTFVYAKGRPGLNDISRFLKLPHHEPPEVTAHKMLYVKGREQRTQAFLAKPKNK